MSFELEKVQFMRFAMCNKTRLQVQMRVNRRAVALQSSAERKICNRTLSRVYWGGEGEAVARLVIYNKIFWEQEWA
jgi:hypothetical protein